MPRPQTIRLPDGRFALPCGCGEPTHTDMALVRLHDGRYMLAHWDCIQMAEEEHEEEA
jgi:hypothetical protein